MKILSINSAALSKTDIHFVFGFTYMNIARRSKIIKYISKHWNKVSSEPENRTEIIQVEVRKEEMKSNDRILQIPTWW